jgi:hypothetical protein
LMNKQTEICCAFNATRYYGWPFPFIALSTTTSDYAEAQRIHHDSALSLLHDGWKLKFQSLDGSSSLPNVALPFYVQFIANVIFSGLLASLIVKGLFVIKKRKNNIKLHRIPEGAG